MATYQTRLTIGHYIPHDSPFIYGKKYLQARPARTAEHNLNPGIFPEDRDCGDVEAFAYEGQVEEVTPPQRCRAKNHLRDFQDVPRGMHSDDFGVVNS